MSAFTFELVEQKKDLLFVGGSSLGELTLEDVFVRLYQDGSHPKNRTERTSLRLQIETILVEGEPVLVLAAGQSALLALSGDAAPVLEAAAALRWKRKGNRYLRTSPEALTLSQQ